VCVACNDAFVGVVVGSRSRRVEQRRGEPVLELAGGCFVGHPVGVANRSDYGDDGGDDYDAKLVYAVSFGYSSEIGFSAVLFCLHASTFSCPGKSARPSC
jgi:hypothetical protein